MNSPAIRPLILLVDDEEDVRTTLRLVLKRHGFDSLEAGDGLQALEILKLQKPALIILDSMMPRMSGGEFMKRIEADPVLSAIPVIVLSGLAKDPSMARAKCTLGKPFEMAEFVATVRKYSAGANS